MKYLKKIFNISKKLKNKAISGISLSEYERLIAMPRYQKTITYLWEKELKINDSNTYLSSLNEIFIDEIYKFDSNASSPIIIDCGANIGLSTLYFRQLHPTSIVYCFEPDPNLFDCLVFNIKSIDTKPIQVNAINKAISINNGKTLFHFEGGHSGMLVSKIKHNVSKVETVRLKDFLSEFNKVDFLKIDIEGHENVVLPDIQEELSKVDKIFIEYHSFLGKEQELSNLLEIIETAGFRYYLKEAYNKKHPFIQREIFLEMDFLINIFCYRN